MNFFSAEGTHVDKDNGELIPLSSIPEDIAKQEHVQLGTKNIAENGHHSSGNQTTALTILAGVGTALFLVTVVIGLVMVRFQSCRNGSNGLGMSRHSSGSSNHSRGHHGHQLGHHNRSNGGSITFYLPTLMYPRGRSNHSRGHHGHQLGHHNRSNGRSIQEHTWRTDSMTIEENSSAHELHVSSTATSDRDLLQTSPGRKEYALIYNN